jgi:hypothetical protein
MDFKILFIHAEKHNSSIKHDYLENSFINYLHLLKYVKTEMVRIRFWGGGLYLTSNMIKHFYINFRSRKKHNFPVLAVVN